jgi:ABC-2 type transport system permease protein
VFVPAHASLRTLRPLANVVGWLPLALPMRAAVAASGSHLAAAGAELALGVVTVVAAVGWWSHTLERIATAPEAAAAPRAVAQPAAPSRRDPLFGAWLAWLPRTRTGAVAARETRVTWRDPRRRVQLVSSLLLPFLVLGGVLARGVSHQPALVYGALLVIGLGGARANNQLGLDGRAWWVHEASGADPASDLRGKNLSLALTSLPIAAGAALILAAVSGGWAQLAAVILFAAGLCGIQLGVGNIVSLRAPSPMPSSRNNAWAANTGQGCLIGLIGIAALFAVGVLSLPAIIAVVLVPSAPGRTVIAVASVGYGYGLWRAGTAVAVRDGRRRGPEILEALNRGQGAT